MTDCRTDIKTRLRGSKLARRLQHGLIARRIELSDESFEGVRRRIKKRTRPYRRKKRRSVEVYR